MKTTAFVPLALLTCSAFPTRKGKRKWHRKPENKADAEKLRRLMKVNDMKHDVGVLTNDGGYHDKNEEAYDPAAYDYAEDDSENDRHLAATGMSGYCPTEYVTCENGYATMVGNVTVGPNVTCQEACDEECCIGNGTRFGQPFNSCTGFNGRVCKDKLNPSCSDEVYGRACYNAKIDEVVNGCNGPQACERAGRDGDLGRVVNSCYGGDYSSCYNAAYNGYIGEIVDSCRGNGACFSTARDGGFIGRVVNSCYGGDNSCYRAARYNGYIGEIVDSCRGKRACDFTAARDGNISIITNGSCVEEESCYGAAFDGGSIGYINHGCGEYRSCFVAAYGRSIDGISYACNNVSACEFLATYSSYFNLNYDSIYSTIVSCCNLEEECTGYKIDQANNTLPDCVISYPTSSPTSSPTNEPTGSPITASPSSSPTEGPTTPSPSSSPTGSPITSSPSSQPTSPPSLGPTTTTDKPTIGPSASPSAAPSPLSQPTSPPGGDPTLPPSNAPTKHPITSSSKSSKSGSKSSKSVKSDCSKKSRSSKGGKASSSAKPEECQEERGTSSSSVFSAGPSLAWIAIPVALAVTALVGSSSMSSVEKLLLLLLLALR